MQQRVTCKACGNQEAPGVRFCGRCGAPMDGSGGPLGRPPRQSQITTGPPPAGAAGGGTSFASNPKALAAVLCVVAVVIVGAVLIFSGGGDEKKDDSSSKSSGSSGGVPTVTAPNVIPTPTPQVVATLAAPTPVPSQPQTQPQPSGQVPPQMTSPLVNLRVTPGGHGQTLKVGTPVELCYGVSAPGIWVRVFDLRSGEVLFPEGPDDGNGDCRNDLAAGPVGVDTVQADAYAVNADGTRGAIRGSASLSVVVVP